MPEPSDLAKTMLNPARASATPQPELANTMVNPARASAAPQPAPSSGATIADTRRSTVLPHVEWTGEKPSVSTTRRDRFQELSQLGRGGMGEVLLYKDHDIDRAVALKRLPPNSDFGEVLRFVEEIRTVGQLEHPNIVPIHDVGVDDQGRYFFVMKHLKGDTLESIIDKLRKGDAATHQRFGFSRRLQVFQGILNAVAYAHGQGILHRDSKPANIMVGPYGEVTVMDWGLAKRVDAPEPPLPLPDQPLPLTKKAPGTSMRDVFSTQAGSVMGTPFYMAPEQARGEALDERTDTYSLTVILHELLYLTHYLEAHDEVEKVLDGVQTDSPKVFGIKAAPGQAGVPVELGWFVLKGFKKAPAERYQSIKEMNTALGRILGGRMRVQCPFTFMKRTLQELQHFVDSHPLLSLLGAAAVAGFVIVSTVSAVRVLL